MRDNQEKTEMPDDYHDGNVSVKVVKLIQSYAKIVKETVWGIDGLKRIKQEK